MSHPGTYVNAPTLGVAGLLTGDSNTAVSFSNLLMQYVESVDTFGPATVPALTFEAVVKPATTATSGRDICGFTSGDVYLGIFQAAAGFAVYLDGSPGGPLTFDDATPIVPNTIYHVAATWDGTNLILYVDGVQVGSDTSAMVVSWPSPQRFYVGDNYSIGDFFNADGVIDEVAWYESALSADRIAAHAAAVTAGGYPDAVLEDSPTLYWRLGESSGTVAEDSASAGNLYTPPIVYDMGPVLPDTQGLQRLLFRHYPAHGRFETVWKLATTPPTYTLAQPYPLITPEDVAQGNMPIGQTYTQATYTHVYYGPEQVDDDEAARLVASGIGTVT